MDAYSLVDTGVRKKLDEMLKTWKNPVPGSQETRPVFPPDITKRIENALIQAKTATLRQQQQQAQNQENMLRRRFPTMKPSMPYQNTPTPPQNLSRYPPPAPQPYVQYNQASNGHPQVRNSFFDSHHILTSPRLALHIRNTFRPLLNHQVLHHIRSNYHHLACRPIIAILPWTLNLFIGT